MAGLVRLRTRAEVGMVFKTIRAKAVAVASVTGVAAALTVGLSAASGAAATGHRGGHHVQLDRAFVIVLENHSQKSVIGDPNTPFITSLAQKYGEAADYFGVTHPSEPNYIAMIGGSNWFINNDDPANRFDHTNLVDELEAKHISWGAYMEALPADPLADFGHRAPIRCMRPSTTRSRCSPTYVATRTGSPTSSPTPTWPGISTAGTRLVSYSSLRTSAMTCMAG
jgi:hypothetical protein